MGLEHIFGDSDARRGNLPTYVIHFKWTFDVDYSVKPEDKVGKLQKTH